VEEEEEEEEKGPAHCLLRPGGPRAQKAVRSAGKVPARIGVKEYSSRVVERCGRWVVDMWLASADCRGGERGRGHSV
jgi:hypothetical protein